MGVLLAFIATSPIWLLIWYVAFGTPVSIVQNRYVRKKVKEDKFIQELENMLEGPLKRIEQGKTVVYRKKREGKNPEVNFYYIGPNHWRIKVETMMLGELIELEYKEGKIKNVEAITRDFGKEVQDHFELFQNRFGKILKRLEDKENERNTQHFGISIEENTKALCEVLTDIPNHMQQIETIHHKECGRYHIKYNIDEEFVVCKLFYQNSKIYDAVFSRTEKEIEKESIQWHSLQEDIQVEMKEKVLPLLHRMMKTVNEYEQENREKNEWELTIEQYLATNTNKEIKEEYESLSLLYHQLNKKQREENTIVYQKALQNLCSKLTITLQEEE